MRKLTSFVVLLLLSVVLVACAGDDEEAEPTAEPTSPPVSTRIVESTPEPTDEAEDVGVASSPAAIVATPAEIDDEATPMIMATPDRAVVATPAASPVVVPATPVASPIVSGMTSDATPVPAGVNEPPARIEMTGVVTLAGAENEAYVLTGEGCVGLGPYSGLRADRQVVIRNEAGTIVSVTSLDASDDADGCAWEFVAAVPESEFYSVSIPMVFEQVFPKAQVGANGGAVEIELP